MADHGGPSSGSCPALRDGGGELQDELDLSLEARLGSLK